MAQKSSDRARQKLIDAGFKVSEAGANPPSLEVGKANCVILLQRAADGKWTPASPPYFLVKGLKCELEDQGYQKFWLHQGQRFPVRATELRALHLFDEEVRYVLEITTLYNEALGSTNARTVYDRLTGRPDQ